MPFSQRGPLQRGWEEITRKLSYTQAGQTLPKAFLGGPSLSGSQMTEERCHSPPLSGFQMKAKIFFVTGRSLKAVFSLPEFPTSALSTVRSVGYNQPCLGTEGECHTYYSALLALGSHEVAELKWASGSIMVPQQINGSPQPVLWISSPPVEWGQYQLLCSGKKQGR